MVRKGNILVLTALFMLSLLAFFALAVDLGYLCLVRTQLQAAADASSLAGAGALFVPPSAVETTLYSPGIDSLNARLEAQQFVNNNTAAQHKGDLTVDLNLMNFPSGDIIIGSWDFVTRTFDPDDSNPNAVQVQIPMNSTHFNGRVRLAFGFLADEADSSASAIAVVHYPTLLPFTTFVTKWEQGDTKDEYTWTPNGVKPGPDGIHEIVIFPDSKWNGSGLPPGNFGALRVGGNGASDFRRTISVGLSNEDLAPFGGELSGGLVLPGETGIMSGMEPAIVGGHVDGTDYPSIIGQSRYLPLYSSVSGNGANAKFVIERFVGVRIMAANLKSGTKWIRIQPVTVENDLLSLHLVR